MLSLETAHIIQWLCDGCGIAALMLLLICIGIGLSRFKQMRRPLKLFLFYLLFVALIEIVAKLIVYGKLPFNNLFLMYPYLLGEFILLSLMYKQLLEKVRKKSLQRMIYYIIFFALVIVIYSIYMIRTTGNDAHYFKIYPKLITHGSILFYAFRFMIASFVRTSGEDRELIRQFIPINNGIFLYFSGSFVFYLALNFLINSKLNVSIILFLANGVLTLIFYSFCLFSLWKYNPRKVK